MSSTMALTAMFLTKSPPPWPPATPIWCWLTSSPTSKAHQKAEQLYSDTLGWQRMSLINVANAGMFSADRAVDDYARDIWHLK